MVTLNDLLKKSEPLSEEGRNYVDQPYDLNLLRRWQRDQLKLLMKLCDFKTVNGALMANASGTAVKSPEFGGKLTALTRAKLMVKAGRDTDGNNLYQLNEKRIYRITLKEFLEGLDI